jgi:hypothetical protein
MDVRRVSVDLPSVIFVLIITHATLLPVSIKQSFLVSQAPFLHGPCLNLVIYFTLSHYRCTGFLTKRGV